ncbi:MAG: hypothetical protein K940chlam7_01466 [Chlamydiae bacterium]|nr:hypothetical protein [Chlamydiota bacterium]
MKHFKSERIKKLETELNDLEQWLKLGLVPKRDIENHKDEIQNIKEKIGEEKERLQFLRDSGETEEYVTPKRGPTRAGYTEMPTLPDIDVAETAVGGGYQTTTGTTAESGQSEAETTLSDRNEEEEEPTLVEEDEESYFSDRNRWKRGGNIIDPDANDW